jgi:hypothetical protein
METDDRAGNGDHGLTQSMAMTAPMFHDGTGSNGSQSLAATAPMFHGGMNSSGSQMLAATAPMFNTGSG